MSPHPKSSIHNFPRFIILIAVSLCFSLPSIVAQVSRTQDRVIVRPRKVVVLRSNALAKRFPEKKRALVTYPVITGVTDPAVARRIRSTFDLKNIFGYSLADYRNDTWLSEFSYTVNHNADSLFDITFLQSGSGAYPDDQSKHFLINLRDGRVVKAGDVFESDKLNALAALVDRELQNEIKRLEKENTEGEMDADQKESISGAYSNLKFEVANLDEFSVGPKGITFLYDAGFPHVIQALAPEGRYFFSYSTLRDYIKADGPLGKFKR